MNRYDKRKKYIGSYAQDAQGNWHYIGQWYMPSDLECRRSSYQILFFAEILLTGLLTVIMGFLPAGPMLRVHGQWLNYVMLCYGLQVIAAFAVLRYTVLIAWEKWQLTEYDIRYTTRILGCAAVCGFCAIATAVAQIAYILVLGDPRQLFWNIVLVILPTAVSIMNFFFFRYLRRIPWEIRENH